MSVAELRYITKLRNKKRRDVPVRDATVQSHLKRVTVAGAAGSTELRILG